MKIPVLLIVLFTSVAHLSAQDLQGEVRAMREELQRLREEVETLKKEIRGGPSVETLPLLEAQVQEQAQTKVETNSRFPMKLFGTITSNTFWNSAEPNWLDNPLIAMPAPVGPRGSLTSSLRQSRIGAIVQGPEVGKWRTSGFFAMDFFGGIPNFQTGQVMGLPRLLYAYVRAEGARTSVEIGQDNMILAPKNPTSLAGVSFPILYRSGNLYLRVPQIRVERVVASGKKAEFHATAGILAPIAGDYSGEYNFVPPNLAGERSRMPALQARLSARATPAGPYEQPTWEIGASGHYSRERYAAGIVPSWAAATDFDATRGRIGIGGEFFVGRNLDSFGGSVAQLAKSYGGFVEARLAATRRLSLNTGYGTDRLFDIVKFPVELSRNASAFSNAVYRFTPEFSSSVEYRWLQTNPAAGGVRRNNHVNLAFAYSF